MHSTLAVNFYLLIIFQKKERALKRQQRRAMLLEGFHNALRTENGRSRRNRKPVSYTFGMCRSFFHIIHLHDWIPVMGCNELFGQMPSNFWSLAALWTYVFIVNS